MSDEYRRTENVPIHGIPTAMARTLTEGYTELWGCPCGWQKEFAWVEPNVWWGMQEVRFHYTHCPQARPADPQTEGGSDE